MKPNSRMSIIVLALIAFATGSLFGQPGSEVRQMFTLQIGDGTLILGYGVPMLGPINLSSYPHDFSFITPPPSMEYIMLPTRPPYKPPVGYTLPPFGYYQWQRPVIIFYPYWHWVYPPHYWWDYKPQLWLMLTRPPVILIFKLNKAKADDVAQRLRESKIHPMLRFMSSGDKLIVTGPQEVLTGVGQARIRELIKALDEAPQTSKSESKGSDLNAVKRKITVETYIATSDGAQIDGSLPQDVLQAANTMGAKSVRMLRTDECEVSTGQVTTINWEVPRASTLNDFRLRGSLRAQLIAADENGTLMNLNLSASVGLPSKSLWARHATSTSILCESNKPTLLISNDATTRSSLILRIQQAM
ncbi:MAG: hypothetical protein RMK18_09230 [Armatimonadota bacterium]|nr:hypothetical protein [Armatimonadota bacterium]MDW8026025.1 hypothetical protein [Armatimonadota bacterium]